MPDLTQKYLPALLCYRPSDYTMPGDYIFPDYQGSSLANIPSLICNWLNIPSFGQGGIVAPWAGDIEGHIDHVILMVLDGLGLQMFREPANATNPGIDLGNWLDYRNRSTLIPLTSVVPSTTASALTSLWTGLPSAGHGIVGYEVWLKEYSLIANMITHSPVSFTGESGSLRRAGFTPETFLQVPTLGPHLQKHGVQPYAMMHTSISRSGLSNMHMPGVKGLPVRTFTDLIVNLEQKIKCEPGEKTYTYIYWGELDDLSHHYGPEDERVSLEYEMIRMRIGNFIKRVTGITRKRYLFIITADHGLIATPRRPEFDLINHPSFLKNLSMQPSGENRMAYLFVRPGKIDAVTAYIRSEWPEMFDVYSAQDFIASGIFGVGKRHPGLEDRIGDLVIVPRENKYWWWAKKDNHLLGRHGGLTQQEMLVPFNTLLF